MTVKKRICSIVFFFNFFFYEFSTRRLDALFFFRLIDKVSSGFVQKMYLLLNFVLFIVFIIILLINK